jgi:hypothetical protein
LCWLKLWLFWRAWGMEAVISIYPENNCYILGYWSINPCLSGCHPSSPTIVMKTSGLLFLCVQTINPKYFSNCWWWEHFAGVWEWFLVCAFNVLTGTIIDGHACISSILFPFFTGMFSIF